jgi:hypothetical protein
MVFGAKIKLLKKILRKMRLLVFLCYLLIMITIKSIASNDQVVIFEVTGLPHVPNVNAAMNAKTDELISQYRDWSFNRYTCVGNPFHLLVMFHKTT